MEFYNNANRHYPKNYIDEYVYVLFAGVPGEKP